MSIYIYVIIGFFMFVIGTLFGSFFSLATYRIPRHQDILIKRSYCPNCKHNLGFFDLIPILSYIIGKGKCRYCKEKISIRYPILELTNGIVFLIFFVISTQWEGLITTKLSLLIEVAITRSLYH